MSSNTLLLAILILTLGVGSTDVLFADQESPSSAITVTASEKKNDSLDRYWQTLVKYPKRGPVFDQVWKAYAEKEQVDALIARCRQLVTKSPESVSARLLEGLVLARQGLHAEALESWRQASKLAPNDVRAFWYRGELLLTDGKLSQAATELEQAASLEAGPVERRQVFLSLGRAYVRLDKKEKATEVWRRFEEAFPDDLEVKYRVAELLTEEGKFSQSLDRYKELIQLCREDESRLRYTFEATGPMARLGQSQEAIATLKTIADELTADHWLAGPVRTRIDELYRQSGNVAGLTRYYESRLVKHPRETETIRRLAQAYIQLGREDDAKKLLMKSLDQTQTSIPLRLILIDLLASKGNLSAVEIQCDEVLRFASNDPTM
ncbi:MAG: tetratricopeptide repeat protein, partial [Planctomycetia bacterium]|nr:tetratricopeptide repeat protein [Planctomycetia bacterium]